MPAFPSVVDLSGQVFQVEKDCGPVKGVDIWGGSVVCSGGFEAGQGLCEQLLLYVEGPEVEQMP